MISNTTLSKIEGFIKKIYISNLNVCGRHISGNQLKNIDITNNLLTIELLDNSVIESEISLVFYDICNTIVTMFDIDDDVIDITLSLKR